MKLVTWNVNSIKARTSHVQRFLKRVAPDILMIQELKGLEFPHDAFPDYHAQAITQKAYNGVAILSKEPVTIIAERLDGDEEDAQARYLEVEQNGLRIINIYLPNGNPWPGEKFDYKLRWMERLYHRVAALRKENIPFLIGGDFNIIPEERDCWDVQPWLNDALYRLESRRIFRAILNLGLTDAFRALNQDDHQYSFWDYQAGCWPADKGIRIDHFLLSPPIADRLQDCTIDREPRGEQSPSDHTPVILSIS